MDSLTNAIDEKLWNFLWSTYEQTAEQTMETSVIWDAIASLWRHCNGRVVLRSIYYGDKFPFNNTGYRTWLLIGWRTSFQPIRRQAWNLVSTLRPRQHGRHFADDTFKRIFLKENVRISNKISLKFVPKSPIDNILALFQMMAWRRPGDKPLSEAMMVSLLAHICVARPQC